jgi:anti-anti-sigma factor
MTRQLYISAVGSTAKPAAKPLASRAAGVDNATRRLVMSRRDAGHWGEQHLPESPKMSRLRVENQAGVTVIRFDSGALSAADVIEVEREFKAVAYVPGQRIVIDLTGVKFVATPAIAMFVGAVTHQRATGGRVIFTGTQGAIDELLRVCRLDMIMTIAPTLPMALTQAEE